MQLNSGTPATTTYNNANQITNSGVTYDSAGNLTNDGTAAYTYDALNRTTARGTTSYTYNGDGTLVKQIAGGTTTLYTQDLAAPLSQVLQTKVGSAALTNYLYGLNRLASLNSGVKTWYAADALGSVRRTVADSGTPLGIINYDPWGTPESGTVPTFGFTGEIQDPAAGLVNLRARWYSTARGRFTSVDPFAGMPETPYSLHQYAYGLSDPVLMTDPSGRAAALPEGGGGQGCLWDLELGRCRNEIESDSASSTGSAIINIDYNGPLIFNETKINWGQLIFDKDDTGSGKLIFDQYDQVSGQLIFTTPPKDGLTCLIFNDGTLEDQLGLNPGYATSSNPNTLPHRPGLPKGRSEQEYRKKGQLTDDEFEFLRQFAQKRGKKIILTGSLSETPMGIQNRINHPEMLPEWRRGRNNTKARPSILDLGGDVRDIDFWQGSGLDDAEKEEIIAFFQSRANDPSAPIEIDAGPKGYSRERYPLQRSFKEPARDIGGGDVGGDGGGIVFYPSGRTERLPATWQREEWP